MKLYVCWGTFQSPRPGGHPCRNAYEALRAAGHDPEVVKSYGWTLLPDAIGNGTEGRRAAKRLTGKTTVPVLELDDGTAVWDSHRIAEWAEANPARPAGAAADRPGSPTA
jgi:glutaredoxin